MSDFILGNEPYTQGKKSLKSLCKHHDKNTIPIFLIMNIKIHLVKTKDYIPRIIPLTHKLDIPTNKSIVLITKDPSTAYRTTLTTKDCPTEDTFNQIISLTKLKSISKDSRKLTKLFKENDIIVSDNRVHKFLPSILGSQFYIKNKRVPFMVQMAKPSATAKLVKSKHSTKLKDERCDPKYVYKQIESIVGNTSYIPSDNGTCISFKIGYTDWEDSDLLKNINDIIEYLTSEKYLPVGGTLKSIDNITSVHVKTAESVSLPVYSTSGEELEVDGEENDSDFDF
ncbi:Ribosome biogenesis protein UTP30 [Spathaspora sp. JA1]|nr:Ribosome biogenesis protein UTP30 [Spathaspora sp. JA1]